jgi:hypothetical protein
MNLAGRIAITCLGLMAGTLVGFVTVWLVGAMLMVMYMALTFAWWAWVVAFIIFGGWMGWQHDGDVKAALAALRQHWAPKALGVVLLLAVTTAAAHAQSCVGDCDNDGLVSIDDLVTAVNVAQGLPTRVEQCPAAVCDVMFPIPRVHCLVQAVNNALSQACTDECWRWVCHDLPITGSDGHWQGGFTCTWEPCSTGEPMDGE